MARALNLYFARKEQEAMEAEFADAASYFLFVQDNLTILRDFAGLDADLESP